MAQALGYATADGDGGCARTDNQSGAATSQMIHSPLTTYCGLTIVLDRPSRFDTKSRRLLSGYAGADFDNWLVLDVAHGVHRGNCEVRTMDETRPLLPGTRCILALGEGALRIYKQDVTLGEQRGSPFTVGDKIVVASYGLQDAYDRKEMFTDDDSDSGDEADAGDSDIKTTHGATQRKNWRFWLRQDVRKAVRIARCGITLPKEPTYHFYPSPNEVIERLGSVRDGTLYFDIETCYNHQLTCIGFAFDANEVWVVPMVQTHLTPWAYYYDEVTTARILRALLFAIRRNTTVVWNCMYDLLVLAWRYHLPVGGRVFDGMLAHNRCYIEVEKSLGHGISLYTDLPYHKNEGVFEPRTALGTDSLYRYNGKDVFALTQLKPAIEARAALLGASESVELANRMVYPYLTQTLQGMRVDNEKIAARVDVNQRMQRQIRERILPRLTERTLEFNPNSWKQVSDYLYGEIGLPKPKDDPTNEKTLLAHQLRGYIPAIDAILAYRQLGKETGKLRFNTYAGPWGAGVYDDVTGVNAGDRLTCAWNLAKTVTMRLSSRKMLAQRGKKPRTYFGGWGDNEQNFAKDLRKVVVPD